MTRRWLHSSILALGLGLGLSGVVSAQPGNGDPRGELLYSTYCVECHRTEMHWRDKRLATDWNSLYAQVRRWQANSGRSWEPGDTRAIARYLNATFYHFAPGDDIQDK